MPYNGIYEETCDELYGEPYDEFYDEPYDEPHDEPHNEPHDELFNNNASQEPANMTGSDEFVNNESLTSIETNATNKNFEEEHERLRKKLQEVPGHISITTDIWTTYNNDKSFISVTIHYLDASWSIKHLLLDFIHMDGQHTGAEIASSMENCLQSMRIISKIMVITHDNVTFNDRFLQDFSDFISSASIQFDDKQQSVRCFTHILNLAVQSIFNDIGKELEMLHALIEGIRGSKIHHAISRTDLDLWQYVLSEEDWEKIELLVSILAPFKEAMVEMSKQEYPTLSMIIHLYYLLVETFNEATNKENILQ
ncbi:20108_t:CDS:2 [Cetraspora pellucida]|uniref:20108_t:CDS:1 n=1 Tax=Cetraspora pellucida TaxID=1433469 RepID=A0A9N9KAH5_9GLOM|nr:20108_t:CDS:2 [Cetraspora pellucida]